jgi:acyl-coenzyme A synthetase/AMP-(fatty) acid ligase
VIAGGVDDRRAHYSPAATVTTYHQLRARVADRRAELDLGQRDIVVLATTNTLEFVVTYLALLDGGHVPRRRGHRAAGCAALDCPIRHAGARRACGGRFKKGDRGGG